MSLLNCFSKVFENIIECRLVDSMYKSISFFISAYRESYNTQHAMLRLERKRENLNKINVVGGVLIDLSKAFDCPLHDLLLAKPAAYYINYLRKQHSNSIHLLESESRLASVKWFKDNKMIVNPGKLRAIILSKKKITIQKKK